MVEVFIDELCEQATLIETAARDSDLRLMERESHIIKSSAGMYGAPRVRSSAARLNKACKVDDASAAFSLAESLAADIPYTIAALRTHYDLPDRTDA
jgi:HPt (histidine-containing phosphotransfer) domain-containing protein